MVYPTYSSAERTQLLSDRSNFSINLGAVSTFFHFHDHHGIIKEISEREGISRSTLMNQIDAVIDLTVHNNATLKTQLKEVKAQNTALRQQLIQLQQRNNGIKSELERRQAQDRCREERFILLAAVLNNSSRDIATLFSCAFNKPLSHMSVCRRLKTYEAKAQEIMKRYFAVGIDTGACDEIYFHGKPVLLVVEALSHCIVAIEKIPELTAAAWEQLIEQLPFLKKSVNDMGSSICSALGNLHVAYQLDLFHAWHPLSQAFSILERKTFALISKEDEINNKLRRLKPYKTNKGARLKLQRQLNRIQEEFEHAAQTYDLVAWILSEMYQSFSWIQPDGTVISRSTVQERLSILCEWLQELCPHFLFRRGIRYLTDEHMTTYIRQLHEKLSGINTTNPFGLSHTRMISYYARCWAIEQGHYTPEINQRVCIKHLLLREVFSCWDRSDLIMQQVTDAFRTTHRASSAVENVNLRLRIYEHVKKHVGDGFLSLIALYHNMTAFKDGAKRQKKSPAQWLNLDLPTFNFFELLDLRLT